jgi:phospholipid-translocating ATPase
LENENSAVEGVIRFFTWFIILSQMVPISLLVSTELVKFGQAVFIAWDNLMYYAPNDKEAVVLSSQLNEDLGQIEYIFTDKTGTLTQNKMEFRVGYVGIEMFGDPKSEIARRVEERVRDCELRQKGQSMMIITASPLTHSL